MTQVFVKYNPYRLKTEMKVNGRDVSADSVLYKVTRGKRLQEWVGSFPETLRNELNDLSFSVEFCGMALDWDDFQDAFENAAEKKVIKPAELKFIEVRSSDDVREKVVGIFNDLQDEATSPIADFRDPKLQQAFAEVNDAVFPINVIATMSSGKSTLINALLRRKLMPSKNEACTATITEILDNDSPEFMATVYDSNSNILEDDILLTYDVMEKLNEQDVVHLISATGDIPFLSSRNMSLKLVDTPGPNNAQNQEHKNITYRALTNKSNSLILYVLNGTQLSTNDDAALLHFVADQIKSGGKQARDRFIFVINKMDGFNPEEESIPNAVAAARKYLAQYGIEDPQVFPCSAFTALNLRTTLAGVDINNLTRSEQKALPQSAKDTLTMVDKFLDYEDMHLERYSTLSPSAQRELDVRLRDAEDRDDSIEQALIHCGICSIEAAITAYVKKYAATKKVKDLVETFYEVLESSKVLANAKTRVASDEAAAKACIERSEAVLKKISDGEEVEVFKNQIESLNPIPHISSEAERLKNDVSRKATKIFSSYGDIITSRDEAKRLVTQFSQNSSDALAELTAELENVINTEIFETGNRMLADYQEKLERFDGSGADDRLEFKTADLIRGALTTMRETADTWTTDAFAAETVDEVGETHETVHEYYEKVGTKGEQVVSGSHQEKVGTKKVKVGSHREQVGTRRVENPNKRWWKLFTPRYITEPVYETVTDYRDEDVYKTVLEYETVYRDVFEKRTETKTEFSVETFKIQIGLTAKLDKNLDDGIERAIEYAEEEVRELKAHFSASFEALDREIEKKYKELETLATDESEKRAQLDRNKKILEWLEVNLHEIDTLLDI